MDATGTPPRAGTGRSVKRQNVNSSRDIKVILMRSAVALLALLATACCTLVDSDDDWAILVELSEATGEWRIAWPTHDRSQSYCTYSGVTCSVDVNGISRAATLTLDSNGLSGSLPGSLGNLSYLTSIVITGHPLLRGTIPSSLGNLTKLQTLTLRFNALTGAVPQQLANLTSLTALDLSSNMLEGAVPSALFTALPLLSSLSLGSNRFDGAALIMQQALNMPSLARLSLAGLDMHGAHLPATTLASALVALDVSACNLAGSLPAWLLNSTQLQTLNLASNALSGVLLANAFANLTALRNLYLNGNLFTGSAPASLRALVALQRLDLGATAMTGELPDLSPLAASLVQLNIDSTALGLELPAWVCSMHALAYLNVSYAPNVGGELNSTVCQLPALKELRADHIALSNAAALLANVSHIAPQLQVLSLDGVAIDANLSSSLGSLSALRELRLASCGLSGTIPSAWGSLSRLERVSLARNALTGDIVAATAVFASRALKLLDLSSNAFFGSLLAIGARRTLLPPVWNISFNALSGTLPLPGDVAAAAINAPSAATPLMIDARTRDSVFVCPVPAYDVAATLVLHTRCVLAWNDAWTGRAVQTGIALGALALAWLSVRCLPHVCCREFKYEVQREMATSFSAQYLLGVLGVVTSLALLALDVLAWRSMYLNYFRTAQLDICAPLNQLAVFAPLFPAQRSYDLNYTVWLGDSWRLLFVNAPSAASATVATFAQVAGTRTGVALPGAFAASSVETVFSAACSSSLAAAACVFSLPLRQCVLAPAHRLGTNVLALPSIVGVGDAYGGAEHTWLVQNFLTLLYAAALSRLAIEIARLAIVGVMMCRGAAAWTDRLDACVDFIAASPWSLLLPVTLGQKGYLVLIARHRVNRGDIWRRLLHQGVLVDAWALTTGLIYLFSVNESEVDVLWVSVALVHHTLFFIPLLVLVYRACREAERAVAKARLVAERKLQEERDAHERVIRDKHAEQRDLIARATREQHRLMAEMFGHYTLADARHQTEEEWRETSELAWARVAHDLELKVADVETRWPGIMELQERTVRAGRNLASLRDEELPPLDHGGPLSELLEQHRRAAVELEAFKKSLQRQATTVRPRAPGATFRFRDVHDQTMQLELPAADDEVYVHVDRSAQLRPPTERAPENVEQWQAEEMSRDGSTRAGEATTEAVVATSVAHHDIVERDGDDDDKIDTLDIESAKGERRRRLLAQWRREMANEGSTGDMFELTAADSPLRVSPDVHRHSSLAHHASPLQLQSQLQQQQQRTAEWPRGSLPFASAPKLWLADAYSTRARPGLFEAAAESAEATSRFLAGSCSRSSGHSATTVESSRQLPASMQPPPTPMPLADAAPLRAAIVAARGARMDVDGAMIKVRRSRALSAVRDATAVALERQGVAVDSPDRGDGEEACEHEREHSAKAAAERVTSALRSLVAARAGGIGHGDGDGDSMAPRPGVHGAVDFSWPARRERALLAPEPRPPHLGEFAFESEQSPM